MTWYKRCLKGPQFHNFPQPAAEFSTKFQVL